MKKYMKFFAEDAGAPGGGGEASGGAGGGTTEAPPSRGAEAFTPAKQGMDRPLPPSKLDEKISKADPQKPEGSGTEVAGTTTPKPFDPEAFATKFGETVAKSLGEAKKETQKKELSPEEAAKLLNIWEPDDAWYKEFDNLESRASAIKKMRDGIARQNDTIAQLRMHELVDALKGELAPQLNMVTEFARTQREERFAKAYPTIAKPELQPLVIAVAKDFESKGQKFDSEAKMFDALANGVADVIKVTNPDFKLKQEESPPAETRRGSSIPSTSPGSGGGGGTGGGKKVEQPRGIAVFS